MLCQRFIVVGLMLCALAGCDSTGAPPTMVPTTYPGEQPGAFDRAFDAARRAMREQGLTTVSEDKDSGSIIGKLASTTVSVSVRKQGDGTTRVQFSASDNGDPTLLDRLSRSYDHQMGR